MRQTTTRPAALVFLALIALSGIGASSRAARQADVGDQERPVEDLMRRGDEARKLGRIDEALSAYRTARRLNPTHYGIQVVIADTLRRAGRSSKASAEFRKALALDPLRQEAYVGLARIDRSTYRFNGAERILQQGLQSVRGAGRRPLWLALAETRRRAGRLGEAGTIFRRVLAADPTAVRCIAGLALIAEERGDLARALVYWNRYLDSKPEDTFAALRRQELLEIRAAIAALHAAVAETPDAEIFTELGRLQSLVGDPSSALDAFREALAIESKHVDARRGLAVALRRTGDIAAAKRTFRRLLRIVPDDAAALYGLVEIARGEDDLRGEEKSWKKLLKERPHDLFAVRAFAEFLDRAGAAPMQRSVHEALETLDGTTVRDASPELLRRHALVLAGALRWPEAAEAIYGALRIDPTDPRTLDVAGDLMFRHRGLLRDLIRLGEEELPDDGGLAGVSDPNLLVLLSRLSLWSGRGAEAADLAHRAVALDPRSAIARSAVAEVAQRIERSPERALEEYSRAVALDPGRVVAHVDLALAHLRNGRGDAAEEAARSGLERLPGKAFLQAILGAALFDQGKSEDAVAAYAGSLISDPADDLGLVGSQYPLVLASLGRNLEARRALRGTLSPSPAMIYREAWAFAANTYSDRRFNGQNWLDWRDRYRGDLSDLQDAHRAIAEMLASLGDSHTRLRDLEETAAIYLARRGDGVTVDSLGRVRPTSRTVTMEEFREGLGYIRLSNLSDPTVVEEVRRALLEMREKEGLILDLRGNRGGLSRAADAIGDLLIGPGEETGVDIGPDGLESQVTGGEGALTDALIVVLVDGQTASAAERLARALAMTGRGVLVGDPTFGKGRAQISRVLPGGATVLVSMGEMLGPDGRPLEGRGLRTRGRIRRPPPDRNDGLDGGTDGNRPPSADGTGQVDPP